MKIIKKVRNEMKKGQTKEEVSKGKERLNAIFKSLKKIPLAILGSKFDYEKQAAIEREKALTAKGRHPINGNLTKIEKHATVPTNTGIRRRTSDDLPIYTAEELKIGKGGNTELCPFDCECCF